jgi:signal transduction histidine kinase
LYAVPVLIAAHRLSPRAVGMIAAPVTAINLVSGLIQGTPQLIIDAPEQLEGEWDGERLRQLLTNLASNATKYWPAGGEVRVTVREVAGEGVRRQIHLLRAPQHRPDTRHKLDHDASPRTSVHRNTAFILSSASSARVSIRKPAGLPRRLTLGLPDMQIGSRT